MISAAEIRSFLLRLPKASVVRLTCGDDQHEIKPMGAKPWAKLSETIEAMRPELIECLAADGSLIRATRTDDRQPMQTTTRTSDAAPEVPDAVQADPSVAMLTHFANLLHRAYEHSTSIAFAKMVELVEQMGARSDSIEARLERAEAQRREAESDAQDAEFERMQAFAEMASKGDENLQAQMMQLFMQGAMNGKTAAAASNGHVRPKNGKAS